MVVLNVAEGKCHLPASNEISVLKAPFYLKPILVIKKLRVSPTPSMKLIKKLYCVRNSQEDYNYIVGNALRYKLLFYMEFYKMLL